MSLKPKYNDNLGVQRDITRTNNDILKAAKSDLFLPGRNKDNYIDQVVENNATLQNLQKKEIERRVEESEHKDEKPGLLKKTWDEFSSGHFLGDVFGAAKNVGSSVEGVIETVANTPKYIMWAGIILVFILLLKK